MKVDVQELSSVKKKVVVSFPQEVVAEELKKELHKIGRKAKIKGFREGKAPFPIIEKVYMPEAMKQYAERVIKESLKNIVEEKKIDIAVRPVIEKEDFTDSGFEYHAVIETHPAIELKTYKGLTFNGSKISVSDEDVENKIHELKSSHAVFEDKGEDDMVEADDLASIRIEKYLLDGKDMGTSEREDIDLSKPSIFPEIRNALIGMKKGEEKEVDFTYSDDIKDEKLKGKPAQFKLKVNSIKKKIQQDNEELAKKLSYESYEHMRGGIKAELEETKRKSGEEALNTDIFKKLSDENPFEVPVGMIEEMAMRMVEDFVKNMEKAKIDIDKLGLDWKMVFENYKVSAEQTLRRHYLVKAIKEAEKLEVDDAELDVKIDEFIEKSQNNPQVAAYFQQNPAARRNIYLDAIEKKVMKFIIANNQVVEG